MRWLGIDHGEKRVGLAVSDEMEMFAAPYRTLLADHKLISELQQIVDRERIGGIVVGLPKNMDGTIGPAAVKAQEFGKKLAVAVPAAKILFWDERLTTTEAQRALHAAGKDTKQSRKIIDQVAAQILLQSYLDSLQWSTA
jgi:putative Holliday junction resolvase